MMNYYGLNQDVSKIAVRAVSDQAAIESWPIAAVVSVFAVALGY